MDKQVSWFSFEDLAQPVAKQLLAMPKAEVILHEQVWGRADSDRYFRQLRQDIHWRQDYLRLGGKTVPLPRLTAWYGEAGKSYTYSGIQMLPEAWTPTLFAIKARVEEVTGLQFNSVLLNLYRTGQDSVAWHSDDEPELGENPIIASVSFGATRRFLFKHKYDPSIDKVAIELTSGSLLLMQGPTQHFWRHQIPKTTQPVGPRINLTFRSIR